MIAAGITAAHAQSVLVSNLSEASSGTDNILTRYARPTQFSNIGYADSFTVGAGSYSLTSISITFGSVSGTAPAFGLYSDTGGHPGSLLAVLTPSGAISTGVDIFTPSTPITLLANTTYWWAGKEAVPASTVNYYFPVTTSASTVGAAGWSIGGLEENGSSYGSAGSYGQPVSSRAQFSVAGNELTAVPEPGSTALMVGAAALGFAAWRRRSGSFGSV